jgi:DNA-binding NarL/FixJ family response regulator
MKMMDKVKIVIVDDDEIVTMSLKMILEAKDWIQVIAMGESGSDAIELYEKNRPDVLLLDIRMKDMTGLDAAKTILKQHERANILFLTTFSDDEYIIKALELGVKGYLLKQDYKAIHDAIKAVLNGQTVFGAAVVDKLPDLLKKKQNKFDFEAAQITQKEFDIIQLVAQGFSNKEIADKVFLSEGTIKNYLSHILDKLELRDRTQLAIFYLKNK